MNLFSNPQVRQEFVIGITETLAHIYNVSDKDLKLSIFNELDKLSDEGLMSKKDLIEGYLERSALLNQTYLSKITRVENEYLEGEEKKELVLQNMY